MTDTTDTTTLISLLCFNTYALNRAFGRFYQAAFSQTGLTYPKFVILTVLDEAGPMTVSDLSARAAVEPNTLSPLLKKMASFDLISRQRAEEDERRVVLALEDKGCAVLERARAVVMEGFAGLGLDADAVAEAVAFLRDARLAVEEADPPKLDLDGVR